MTTPTITVALDPLVTSKAAIRWAVREAARRRANLRITMPVAYDDEGPQTAAKLAGSADAELLVVAGPAPDVDELVMRSYCPIVIVPDREATPDRRRSVRSRQPPDPRPVVVGAGPATEPEVLAFAFAEAADRRAGLLAVRTWNEPLIDLARMLSDPVDRWDEADEQNREDLAQQLSVGRLAYPDVPLEQLAVNDHCADKLADLADHAQLLVLGRPARGALLNGLAASPAITLARHVPCPVVIVPPLGQVRTSWWPRRPVGLADLRG
jgi:nucleotide-binding universal stress UspA family protein